MMDTMSLQHVYSPAQVPKIAHSTRSSQHNVYVLRTVRPLTLSPSGLTNQRHPSRDPYSVLDSHLPHLPPGPTSDPSHPRPVPSSSSSLARSVATTRPNSEAEVRLPQPRGHAIRTWISTAALVSGSVRAHCCAVAVSVYVVRTAWGPWRSAIGSRWDWGLR
ncbi:hypothetical protein PSPO01_08764 [Paraphaeosphaeria sporulosa]